MKHPTGFVYDPSLVNRPHHFLYVLKESHKAWYDILDNFFLTLGFNHCHYNPIVLHLEKGFWFIYSS